MTFLINLINNFSILLLVKLMIIISLGLYSFFAFLISRQIQVMNKAVSTQHGKAMYFLGLAHFLVSIFVLALAIIIL